MSSFISNFRAFKNVYRLLLLFLIGLVCGGSINMLIYHKRQKQEAAFPEERLWDDFFGKKFLPGNYPVIFYGDSRTFYCLDPATVSEKLQRPAFNLGFSAAGMNDAMMKVIDSRLDKSNKNAVVVLGITPYSLTEKSRKNDCYNSYGEKFRKQGQSMFLDSAGPHWFDIALMPTGKVISIGSNRGRKEFQGDGWVKYFHDNGWVGTVINGDTERSVTQTLEIYAKQNFNNNPFSDQSIDEMLHWVRKWSSEGVIVIAFRPPSCGEMEAIEEQATAFSKLQIDKKIQASGGIWWDCPRTGWVSYDASHLDEPSAIKLSEMLSEVIAKQK